MHLTGLAQGLSSKAASLPVLFQVVALDDEVRDEAVLADPWAAAVDTLSQVGWSSKAAVPRSKAPDHQGGGRRNSSLGGGPECIGAQQPTRPRLRRPQALARDDVIRHFSREGRQQEYAAALLAYLRTQHTYQVGEAQGGEKRAW